MKKLIIFLLTLFLTAPALAETVISRSDLTAHIRTELAPFMDDVLYPRITFTKLKFQCVKDEWLDVMLAGAETDEMKQDKGIFDCGDRAQVLMGHMKKRLHRYKERFKRQGLTNSPAIVKVHTRKHTFITVFVGEDCHPLIIEPSNLKFREFGQRHWTYNIWEIDG